MKRTLFSLGFWALLLVAPRVANSADVSVDFFYNNLSGGSWIEVGDYGYCWQPDVAVSNSNWRPYADGYWAYTDLGWTWVSYEDFGWATYHYGRWAMVNDTGWVWVPGRDADLEWGPAWVSWRTGGEYIGWAPLPPETIAVVESRPLTGHLDVEFNIGPAYYNFVDVRYIGEPVLRERIIAPAQNITYIQQTVNVTNITYRDRTVYNYGPDINVINRTAARPIQRLRLDREQNVDVTAAARSGGLTKVQGDRLVVAAPMHISRPARQMAPPSVKTKIAAAKIDRGWSGVGDEKAQAEFKQKIKTQDLKNVPPPTTAGAAGQTNAAASASPATAGAGAATDVTTQAGQGQGKGRRGRGAAPQAATGMSPGTGISPAATASPAQGGAAESAVSGRGRGQGRRGDRFPRPATAQPSPASAGSPAEAAGTAPTGANAGDTGAEQGQGTGRRGRRAQQLHNPPTPPPTPMTNPATEPGPSAASEQGQPGAGGVRQGRRGQGQFQNNGNPPAAGADQGMGPGGRRRERAQGAAEGQQQGQGQGQGQGRRGGKKQPVEATPAPSPQ